MNSFALNAYATPRTENRDHAGNVVMAPASIPTGLFLLDAVGQLRDDCPPSFIAYNLNNNGGAGALRVVGGALVYTTPNVNARTREFAVVFEGSPTVHFGAVAAGWYDSLTAFAPAFQAALNILAPPPAPPATFTVSIVNNACNVSCTRRFFFAAVPGKKTTAANLAGFSPALETAAGPPGLFNHRGVPFPLLYYTRYIVARSNRLHRAQTSQDIGDTPAQDAIAIYDLLAGYRGGPFPWAGPMVLEPAGGPMAAKTLASLPELSYNSTEVDFLDEYGDPLLVINSPNIGGEGSAPESRPVPPWFHILAPQT